MMTKWVLESDSSVLLYQKLKNLMQKGTNTIGNIICFYHINSSLKILLYMNHLFMIFRAVYFAGTMLKQHFCRFKMNPKLRNGEKPYQ